MWGHLLSQASSYLYGTWYPFVKNTRIGLRGFLPLFTNVCSPYFSYRV